VTFAQVSGVVGVNILFILEVVIKLRAT